MKFVALLLLSCALWEVKGYPYYPYYGNVDSLSYGASDSSRGGMVLSRYYSPYYNPQLGSGTAAFMFKPEDSQPSQYYLPDRRRQTPQETFIPPPQENEVYPQPQAYPQLPERPVTEVTELATPTDKAEVIPTTVKAVVPEIVEPEVEEVEEQKPRKATRKQAKRPVEDEEDEQPKMPTGAFFPMFFGYGRNGGSPPGGATAIANAYSTGRGGVATSHATAYGMPTPDFRNFKEYQAYLQKQS